MEALVSWVKGGDGELVVYPPTENTKKRKACSQPETSDAAINASGGTSQVPHHIDIWSNALTKSRSIDIAPIQLKRPPLTETNSIDYPRCMEWLPFQSGTSIALGIKKSVQICNLMAEEDDIAYDYHLKKKFLLGGTRFENRKKGKDVVYKEVKRKSSHDGLVLGLSINLERNLLASSSADCIVKLWNLENSRNIEELKQHVSEVNAVSWEPTGHNLLLSGSIDRTVVMIDWRVHRKSTCTRWETTSGVKSLAWNPMVDHEFFAHLVNGEVLFYDTRKSSVEDPQKSSEEWSIKDFDEADKISAIAYNPLKKDVFAMGSRTGKFKVLDRNCMSHEPSKVRQLCQENISTLTFRPNDAALLAYACSNNEFGIIRDESLV